MLNPTSIRTRLPWDNPQLRLSDAVAVLVALLLMAIVMFIEVPPLPKAKLTGDFNPYDRAVLLPPAPVEAPKTIPVEVPKEEKAKEVKTEPKPTPAPKVEVRLDQAKVIPKAAAPKQQDEITTVRQGGGGGNAGKASSSTTPAAASGTNAGDNGESNTTQGSRVAEEVAHSRAVKAVEDTGLSNALSGLDTFSQNSQASAKERYSGGAPTIGGEQVTRNNRVGNGKGGTGNGNGSGGKGGTNFGSATASDTTGFGNGGTLSGKATKGADAGSIIKDKGSSAKGDTAGGKKEAASGKRNDFQRVMSSANGRVQQAFKRALDDDPTLGGKVSLRVKVSANGDVVSASVSSSDLNNAKLENQILAIVKGLNFASGNFDTYEGKYDYNFVGE